MRGTVDVVTSLCADEMTGVLPTSTTESKVCKTRPGPSARATTGNSRSSSARCNTVNSDRTGKEDDKEFCLIEVRVPLRLSGV